MALQDREPVYFYELHEGDDEVYSDILLAHDSEYDEREFLDLVLEARGAVLETFEDDTLSEAIARELERRHGFVTVDERQLRVAVNVSANEGETAVADVDESGLRHRDDGEADGDFRSLVLDIEPEDSRWDG